MVWSTFYDIRRYGGLQIYLRAVLSGSPLVLSSAGEPTREFLRAPAPRESRTFGNALALAPRADERRDGAHRAGIRAPVGRGCRSNRVG